MMDFAGRTHNRSIHPPTSRCTVQGRIHLARRVSPYSLSVGSFTLPGGTVPTTSSTRARTPRAARGPLVSADRCAEVAARRLAAVVAAILVRTVNTPSHAQIEATRAAATSRLTFRTTSSMIFGAAWRGELARSTAGTTCEYGADVGARRTLANYWQKTYDWHAQEACR
jgi:hypothetical protein